MSKMKNINILIKIAKVDTNILTGERIFYPVILPEQDKLVYSEFLKIIDDKNKLSFYLPGEEKLSTGDFISQLKVGESFSIKSSNYSFSDRRTTTVEEIITPNLFRTKNSLYFLKDEKFFIQQNREEKLNQIIND